MNFATTLIFCNEKNIVVFKNDFSWSARTREVDFLSPMSQVIILSKVDSVYILGEHIFIHTLRPQYHVWVLLFEEIMLRA